MFQTLKTFALDHPILVGYAITGVAVVVSVVASTKIDNALNLHESE